jgi:hypothetical protein
MYVYARNPTFNEIPKSPHLGLRSANDPRTLQMQGGGNGGTTAADTGALRGPI